jgi:hypothetical protein
MPVAPHDRPIASVREETIDRLIVNYGHGKLSLEAFERRLDQALEAKTADQLLTLVADLDLIVDKAYADAKREELSPHAPHVPPGGPHEVEHMLHIFGGSNRGGTWTVPQEIRMLNIFGGGELDFSKAQFTSPVVRIKMLCLFGGTSIFVAEDQNVISKALCIFGGVDNRGGSVPRPGSPTIIIEGFVMFGGASIRVRKSMRERWMEFAAHVKSAFGPIHNRY